MKKQKNNYNMFLILNFRYWPNDYQNLGNTYINIGVLNREFYQFDEALTAYDKAEEIFKKQMKTLERLLHFSIMKPLYI